MVFPLQGRSEMKEIEVMNMCEKRQLIVTDLEIENTTVLIVMLEAFLKQRRIQFLLVLNSHGF